MRKITLGQLNISPTGRKYVLEALDNNRLSAGPFTKKFEDEFAELHSCKHGIFMNSGTSALQVALAALKEHYGYQDGDEILVPATTFIATSNVVIQNNLKPVFVDVDPETYNIDPEKITEKITSNRTRAIIPVHLFGLPADMQAIMEIAKCCNLQVLEDSCETVAAGQFGQSVGSFGDIAAFSNYVAHHVVGGVGGLVTTNNDTLATLCRSLMAHGRDSLYTNIDQDDDADEKLLKAMVERRYSFDRVGYSYRCTELEAAIALSELENLDYNLRRRRTNAGYLTWLLDDLKDRIQLPTIPVGFEHSFMMFPFVLDQNINRDDFLFHLEKHNIETRLLMPLLTQPIYRTLFPGLFTQYPVAQRLTKHGGFIGCHQGLTLADIEYVSDVIHGYFK